MQKYLQNWITKNYVDGNRRTPPPSPSRRGGRCGRPRCVVEEVEGNPGYYNARFYLRPHYQLEGVNVEPAAGLEAAVAQGRLDAKRIRPAPAAALGARGDRHGSRHVHQDRRGRPGEAKDSAPRRRDRRASPGPGACSNPARRHTGGGGGSGKVNVQDLSFTKYVDKSSTDLMLFCCNGKHVKRGDADRAEGRREPGRIHQGQDERLPHLGRRPPAAPAARIA